MAIKQECTRYKEVFPGKTKANLSPLMWAGQIQNDGQFEYTKGNCKCLWCL